MLFRFFGQRRSPRRYPTIHSARRLSPYEQQLRQAEMVNLRLRRYYKYHAQVRADIGQDVDEAMRLADEPHESLTEAHTQETRIIPFDPYKTQPLNTPEKGR